MTLAPEVLDKLSRPPTPGDLSSINEALARLPHEALAASDVVAAGVALRDLRKQASRPETLDGREMREAVAAVATADGLSLAKRHQYLGALIEQEVAFREVAHTDLPVIGEALKISEQAVGADGVASIKIIQPGWGSSGYYDRSVLERDVPRIYAPGTSGAKMFWNHQTESEEDQRPEGDLRDLAAEIITTPRWLDGPEGPGMYADARVHEEFRPAVNDLAPYVGVSIRANGRGHQGEAEGRTGTIVEALTEGISVDFVTVPGAGGKVVSLFESYRRGGSMKPKESSTDPKALRTLLGLAEDATPEAVAAAVATAEGIEAAPAPKTEPALAPAPDPTKVAAGEAKSDRERRMEERIAVRDAKDIVADLIESSATPVPGPTATRLKEQLVTKVTLTEEGDLDIDAFTKVAEKAITDELTYINEASGAGRVRGMGGGSRRGPEMSEADRKTAAEKIQKNLESLGSSAKGAELAMAD